MQPFNSTMADPLQEETAASVGHFIRTQSATQNDTERLAALLLISDLAKSNTLTINERRKVYEALDLEFIVRLLNSTEDPPHGCEKETCLSLGLRILLCFVKETGLVLKVNIDIVIPILMSIITERHAILEATRNESILREIQEDSHHLLMEFSSTEKGCERILQNDGLALILDKIAEKCPHSIKYSEILVAVLSTSIVYNLKERSSILLRSLKLLSNRFCEVDNYNLELLEQITRLCALAREHILFDDNNKELLQNLNKTMLKKLRQGLMDVLQSKVKQETRKIAIKQASVLIDIFGMDWTLHSFSDEDSKYSEKFLLLLTSLASIEISVCFDKIEVDYDILSASLIIIENAIKYLCANEDVIALSKTDTDDAEFTSKLFSIALEAIQVVVTRLMDTMVQKDVAQSCEDIETIACVRILCAWMCQETMAIKEDLIKLAPYLVQLGKVSAAKEDPVLFNFLLPVLCHWSADDGYRRIMLQEEMHVTLALYIKRLFLLDPVNGDCRRFQSLETVLGIFLNLAVTEWKIAAKSNGPFWDVREIIVANLNIYMESCKLVSLIANMVTLGLMLTRLQHEKLAGMKETKNFFPQCLTFFYESFPIRRSQNETPCLAIKNWPEISEWWLIGMDNLTACIPLYPGLAQVLSSNDAILEMSNYKSNAEGLTAVELLTQKLHAELNF